MTTLWQEEHTDRGRILTAGTTGPDVVLVHGLEDRPETWTPVAQRLATTCRVTALEMPWLVGSQHTWLTQGTPGAWLSARLEETGLTEAHLVGHSFGGHAVLAHLASGATNPSALLLAPLHRTRQELSLPDSARRVEHSLGDTVIEGLHQRLGTRRKDIDPETLDLMGSSLTRDVVRRALPTLMTCLLNPPVDPAANHTPTRVLVRDGDPSLSRRAAAELGTAPNTTVLEFAGDGHFLHLIHPNEVAGHILNLIEQTHLSIPGGKTPCPSSY